MYDMILGDRQRRTGSEWREEVGLAAVKKSRALMNGM